MPYKLTASLVCANMLALKEEVALMEIGGIDYIHFDVMDGLFVPRYGLHPEMLKAVKSVSKLPVDVHLMVENPEPYIEDFAKVGADYFAPHIEPLNHIHRIIKKTRDAGMRPGVALNPGTPINVLDSIIDDLDIIILMAINPGIVGHKLIPSAINKISALKKYIGNRNILIQIDGGVTFETAPIMLNAGADMLVCGSSTIFKPDTTVANKTKELRAHLNSYTRNSYSDGL
jgi:ribulose-phosphate 3-epimerase